MTRLIVPVDRQDHAQGFEDALVTLVEYGDYECPYCGEAYPILRAVQRAMGERLRFVFRNFPISELHPHAVRAAQFAETAAGVGKFWQAHDMLYEHQTELSDDHLFAYGESLRLEVSAIEEGFRGRFDQKIRSDFIGGVRSGVNGTPTLFINGLRYDGKRDIDSLVAALDQAASETHRLRTNSHQPAVLSDGPSAARRGPST